jgi:predicted dinucleotide-binding enzyme
MRRDLKIGIIGAGNIGGTLTRRFRALGHPVHVANSRGPASLKQLAFETGATAVPVSEAVRDADVIIVTIPESRIPDLPLDLFDGATRDAIVIDTGNYYPRERDGRIEGIEAGATESRWVSEQLGRPVVKAFNNIHAQHLLDLGRPAGDPHRIALPIAGDDPTAKAVVGELLDELGFDVVDGGGIDDSWRQQPGTPVYTADLDAEGVRRGLAQASRERTAQWSATPNSPGSFDSPA